MDIVVTDERGERSPSIISIINTHESKSPDPNESTSYEPKMLEPEISRATEISPANTPEQSKIQNNEILKIDYQIETYPRHNKFAIVCVVSWIVFILLIGLLFGCQCIPTHAQNTIMILMIISSGVAGFLLALCILNFVQHE